MARFTYGAPPIGTVLGLLTVIGKPYTIGRDHARVECRCECGLFAHPEAIPEWAERVGIAPGSLWNRLSVYGWPMEIALTRPRLPGIAHRGHVQPATEQIMFPLAAVAAADMFAKNVTKSQE